MARLAQRFALLIFILASLVTAWGAFAPPGEPHPHLFPWDKAEHFSAFAVLATSGVLAFPRMRLPLLAALLSLAGGMIEVIQALPIVNRDADVMDWVADSTAVAMVMAVIVAARFRRAVGG